MTTEKSYDTTPEGDNREGFNPHASIKRQGLDFHRRDMSGTVVMTSMVNI